MDPEKAVEMVDENTICVAAILGSTLSGEFEDVKLLNDLLEAKNKETGYVPYCKRKRCFHICQGMLEVPEYVIYFDNSLSTFGFVNSMILHLFID